MIDANGLGLAVGMHSPGTPQSCNTFSCFYNDIIECDEALAVLITVDV